MIGYTTLVSKQHISIRSLELTLEIKYPPVIYCHADYSVPESAMLLLLVVIPLWPMVPSHPSSSLRLSSFFHVLARILRYNEVPVSLV